MHGTSSTRKPSGCLFGGIILLVAIVIVVYLMSTKAKVEVQAIPEKSWNISVQKMSPQALSPQLTLYGKVEAPHTAQLTAVVAGDVLEVLALTGQRVEKGQTLARLDAADAQVGLQQATAQLQEAQALLELEAQRAQADKNALANERQLLKLVQRSLERTKRLRKQRVSSEAQLDEAQQALARQQLAVSQRQLLVAQQPARLQQLKAQQLRAQANVDQAERNMARTVIKAPFAGFVSATKLAPGNRVVPGQLLFEVYDASLIEVRAQVPSRYLAAVRALLAADKPAAATITLDAQQWAGQLARVAGSSTSGGGLDAYVSVNTATTLPEPGRTAQLLLPLAPVTQAVAIPFDALYGLDHIFRVRDKRLESLPAKPVGDYLTADGHTLLLVQVPLLEADDQILVTQLPNALDGLSVNPVAIAGSKPEPASRTEATPTASDRDSEQ